MTKSCRALVRLLVSPLMMISTGIVLCPVAGAEIIENRDGQSEIATWWGSDATAPYVYTLDFANTQHVHSAPYSLKIDYNKANDPSNSYSFISAMGRWNFRNFDYLSFWVYNDGSPLKIRIHLEDKNGNAWESNWAGMDLGTTTTNADWENIVVDLTRTFSATNVDFTDIEQLMFIVAPGDTTNRGTFWLDDIALTRSPNGAPIEPFESDFYGWSGGGVFASMTNTTEQFQNSGGTTNLGQKSLKIVWPAKAANYDNFVYTPAHDPNAPKDRIGQYTNFTLFGNNTVELWVKSSTDNNMPILLKLSGSSGTSDVSTVNYTGAGAWQKLTWNFAAQSNIASKLQTVWIFPYPGAADNGGTMYIDNMNLTGGTGPVLPLAPTGFVTTATVPDGDGIYTVKWSSVTGVTDYQLQESTNINFKTFTTTNLTGTSVGYAKSVTAGGVTYYYRVCSRIISGGVTNLGNFAAALPVTVKQIPTAQRSFETIENLDGTSLVATWWGGDSVAPYVYTIDFANTQKVHNGKFAMKVDFNKANETNNPYSFFSAMGLFNLQNYDYLSFWVYNTGAPLKFRLHLEDRNGNPWESNWAGIEPVMKTTNADWENLVVDLTRTFSATNVNWSEIAQIMFMVQPGDIAATGTFWMDDVELHRAPNSAPLETFESDFYGWSSGGPFTITNTSAQFWNDGSLTGLGQQSLMIKWTNKPADYSNVAYTPSHDTNAAPAGRIGNYPNFALYSNTFVELWAKSTNNNMPMLLKFDGMDVSIQTYTGSGAWQRMTWDYSGVAGATNVTTMYLYPYPNQASAGGTLYIDDLNVLGGSKPAVPPVVTGLQASATVNSGNYTVQWSSASGAVAYEVQEATSINFNPITRYVVTTPSLALQKNPATAPATYYYRVHAGILNGGTTNYGSCGKPVTVQVKQYETLDGFEGTNLVSTWWTSGANVYTMDFANTQYVHSGRQALKVAYNKAASSNAYEFFSASGTYNLRNYDYLSFWVYNNGSPLKFHVRLEDGSGNPWESEWAGIEPQMTTTNADWENLVVDLSRTFSATSVDWSNIRQIIFMVQPGDTSSTGTFWMDDIEFERAPNNAPLEIFESDLYGWSASSVFVIGLASNEFHNDGTTVGLGQRSLKVAWTNKVVDYSNITYDPLHDTNAAPLHRIGNYTDFTFGGNYQLELWVKSPTETNMPILLKFDNTDLGVQTYSGSGWQKLTWSYYGISGAANVSKVYVIPYPNTNDAGGTIYLDDMNLVGGTSTVIPAAPPSLTISSVNMGNFTVSWGGVAGAINYELQESLDPNFGTIVSYFPTGTTYAIYKDPTSAYGTFYYRVRSNVPFGGQDCYGTFSLPASAYVPQMSSGVKGVVQNHSYETTCAEVDNLNIGMVYTNTKAYRITVTHPLYFSEYGTNVNERGADFDTCSFTDTRIWTIGTNDGSWAEFMQSGYGEPNDYYAQDNPPAGIDQPCSNFPKEINNDWLQDEYIHFTADSGSDVNIEQMIGSILTVAFGMINGTLEIRVWTWNGSGWTDQGSRVFNSTTFTNTWSIPDFTWLPGTDANSIHLQVVTASQGGQSTPGAWALYDYVGLRQRDQAGEYPPVNIWDDGNVVVDTVGIDFWWRAPESMRVSIAGTTNAANCQYFRITKREPDTNVVAYSQVLVLYEDGNCRLLPAPPAGVDWVPFGASVILGPTAEGVRPYVSVTNVVVYPSTMSMDLMYAGGGSSHVQMWAGDRSKNVVDVSNIQYDTTNFPFARLRSMWVYDGKADLDRVEYEGGDLPILGNWTSLVGWWWQFYKEVPTYHNTYCPDLKVEVTDPSKAFLIRQAEVTDGGTNFTVSLRSNARAGQTITFTAVGGEADYNINLSQAQQNVHLLIRYADDDGGNNGDYPGNLVQVYVDGQLKDQTYDMTTGGWNTFSTLPSLFIGNLSAGAHAVRIVVGGLTFGMDLDELQFVAEPMTMATKVSVLTQQAETLNFGTNYTITARTNAVGGQDIAMAAVGGEANYSISLASAVTNAFIQLRYSDAGGNNKVEIYLDGFLYARYPSVVTGDWNAFTLSPEIWLGNLLAGNHTIKLKTYNASQGVELDQFELYRY